MIKHTFLDAHLVGRGLLTESQLVQARVQQHKLKSSLPVTLLKLGWIDLMTFEELLDVKDSVR
ncbi:DUF2949 domain-containing protein [Leptolyngbya sp. FACHB-261]|uniref:DUF2949 domain-containing protein n=1 Tax=Leptolyngbya sp. FACHB-261 TaxID=2692806 RepID=UPI0016826310|nr:DUF2949 domain-containing protein [Leptolyngbya sp. FACHB-261]MBD2103804.1 DUF2949 domain-containing protein [Leptolyngbya sp. FACHB-261]